MTREYDSRTGRPVVNGQECIAELSDDELEVEVTIAVAEPRQRARRLDELLLERARRRNGREPLLA